MRFCTLVLCASSALVASSAPALAAGDPLCTRSYAGAHPRAAKTLRFGIDPGIAGTVGGVQLPSAPDDPARDLSAVRRLRPRNRVLVVRLSRLFWSDGQAGINRFKSLVSSYTRMGDEVELQVRYHPGPGEGGDIVRWKGYVRHVVDVFGANPLVVAMTITNEVNVSSSPNTSDGAFPRAEDALIAGIEAAHSEALKRGFSQLQFGFTYAYRLVPTSDVAFFKYLAARGGRAFVSALGFVGLDFYPGTVYPPVMLPGDTYSAELAQAAGVVRRCFAPLAGIPRRVPLWITENGVPTGILSQAEQAAALEQLVDAAYAYSRTFGITDYRWFNLRDSNSSGAQTLSGLTFATDGLLLSNYARKQSFAAYRRLIAALGMRSSSTAISR